MHEVPLAFFFSCEKDEVIDVRLKDFETNKERSSHIQYTYAAVK
jgi:hypothetical protein